MSQRSETIHGSGTRRAYDPEGVSAERTAFDRWFTAIVYGFLRGLGRHWLALVNFVVAVYSGLPFLAPYLESIGQHASANTIYFAYQYACHQLPYRSFYVWGEKMAFCQRDAAIMLSFLAAGLVFAFVRGRIKPPSYLFYAVLCAPMVIDGTLQLIGLYESTWEMRVFTGTLFGLATAWLVLPNIQQGANELLRSLERSRD